MEAEGLVDFISKHMLIIIALASLAVFLINLSIHQIGFYTWYFVVFILALAGSLLTRDALYFYAFLLGMVTAFAEIIGKFSDEPIKSLRTPHALFYHVLNGAIAAFALWVLLVYGGPHDSDLDRLKIVLAAGIGSMLVMRSKLFNIKVGGEDIAFGPEQIIKVFLRFMEGAIDRTRAQSRIDFVRKKLSDFDFKGISEYSRAMLYSSQARDEKAKTDTEQAITQLVSGEPQDNKQKCYRLGFLLLNLMGEDFVGRLVDGAPAELKIRAPLTEGRQQTLLERLAFVAPTSQVLAYFAYGSSMCRSRLRERLGWSNVDDTKFEEATKPKRATLEGYRLLFNKPIQDAPSFGLANIMPDDTGTVEGVLFQLSRDQIEFLDLTENGYVRRSVSVTVEGTKGAIDAQVYIAAFTKDGLRPQAEYLHLLTSAARDNHLSAGYIDQNLTGNHKALESMPLPAKETLPRVSAAG
jgi:hypothetical protein